MPPRYMVTNGLNGNGSGDDFGSDEVLLGAADDGRAAVLRVPGAFLGSKSSVIAGMIKAAFNKCGVLE